MIVALTTADHPKNCWLKTLRPSSGHTQGCRAVPGTDLSSASILGRLKTYFLTTDRYKAASCAGLKKNVFPSVRCTSKRSSRLFWGFRLKDFLLRLPMAENDLFFWSDPWHPLAITRKSLDFNPYAIPVKPINLSIFQSCFCSRNTLNRSCRR